MSNEAGSSSSSIYEKLIAFVVAIFTLVISLKIITSEITIDLSGFSFSDFLALCLSLFSIALALIFYLKATETSNTFYDNTYKFTSHISEVLGRIETGFSEKLRHIDEGYSRLDERFARLSPGTAQKAEKEIEEEKRAVEAKERERDEFLQSVLKRAQFQEHEKNEILDRLRDQERELEKARDELAFLRRSNSRRALGALSQAHQQKEVMRRMTDYARQDVVPVMGENFLKEAAKEDIGRRFSELRDKLVSPFLNDMRDAGFIDRSKQLTDEGIDFLRSLIS